MKKANILNQFLFLILLLVSNQLVAQKAPSWKDIASWKSISSSGNTEISPNGTWFAYLLTRADEGDAELILQKTSDTTRFVYVVGVTSRATIAFSDDSRFFAYKISPTEKEKKDKKKAEKVVLLELGTTNKKEFDQIKSFAFNGKKSSHLTVLLAPEEGTKPTDPKGTDLLLYDLGKKQTQNIGNVSEYAFNKNGNWLALALDTRNQAGNGVVLHNLETGVVRPMDTDKASFESMNWNEEGTALALVKGTKDKKYKESLYTLIGIKGLAATPEIVLYDPKTDSLHFPKGMTISPNRDPQWTDDLSRLTFGFHKIVLANKEADTKGEESKNEVSEAEQLAKVKADTTLKTVDQLTKALAKLKPDNAKNSKDKAEKPDVAIWNWQDNRLQSKQQVQESQDKRFSFVGMYEPVTKQFSQISGSTVRTVRIAPKQQFAIGTDNQLYEWDTNLDGQNYADVYLTDLTTGNRIKVREKHYLPNYYAGPSPSPDGLKFLYWADGHFYAYSMKDQAAKNITEKVPTSFVDTEDDHNVKQPPYPVIGWSNDSKYVLLSNGWDIWKVAVEETPETKGRKSKNMPVWSAYTNLTKNGKSETIRYENRFQLDPDEKGVDLSKPMYVRMYGETTKKSGIAQVDGIVGGTKALLWEDATIRGLSKAKNSDYFVYSSETFTKPTQYFGTTSAELTGSTQISQNAPDFGKYAWSAGTRLVNYISDKGDSLQGALFLPAGYVEGNKYPTVVYYYEKLSQTLHNFVNPSYGRTGWNPAMYTSNGYAVFIPDIVYRFNDPGMSAVWCVLPAVKAAIATGVLDPSNIGIHGHSWGGYQTSFLITQTPMFKAAAAGAPLTDMISMYNLIYWNSGGANGSIFEASQGRLEAPWDNWDAYNRNSPIYHVKKVQTPLLLLHNDKDGAVDFTQGIEYFNALRRLKKPVVLIQYKGENHGLAKMPNRKDYSVRMMEFFDHHLKGSQAPEWWSKGVPKLELDEHLEDKAFD
jgi:dipeptidyl aminopeptidase/acylaminoacyl peptidase